MNPLDALADIDKEVLQPLAPRTDAEARFPREAIAALGKAGLLGLVSATAVGGQGLGLKEAAQVVAQLAQTCPSTAMVVCMHYCATAVLEQQGPEAVRKAVAEGRHLSTLAFSEADSRSHFWAPTGTARADGDGVLLDARKSWVTSAFEADSYVWSSKPLAAEGASTLWLVGARAEGLSQPGRFDGLGLRGNASTPIAAKGVRIAASDRLGEAGVRLPGLHVPLDGEAVQVPHGDGQSGTAPAGDVGSRHHVRGGHIAREREGREVGQALTTDVRPVARIQVPPDGDDHAGEPAEQEPGHEERPDVAPARRNRNGFGCEGIEQQRRKRHGHGGVAEVECPACGGSAEGEDEDHGRDQVDRHEDRPSVQPRAREGNCTLHRVRDPEGELDRDEVSRRRKRHEERVGSGVDPGEEGDRLDGQDHPGDEPHKGVHPESARV